MEKILPPDDGPKPGPGGRSCSTCLAWDEVKGQPGVGLCRSLPPKVTAVVLPAPPNIMQRGPAVQVQPIVNYPGTNGFEWCMQWHSKVMQ